MARAVSIPIASGENEYTRYGFRDLIEREGAAILNADAQILGGITEFMQVAARTAAEDLVIAPHGAQEAHIHLVCAIANGLILEFYRETVDPLRMEIFEETMALDADGNVAAPEVLARMREIARVEGRQFQEVMEEAMIRSSLEALSPHRLTNYETEYDALIAQGFAANPASAKTGPRPIGRPKQLSSKTCLTAYTNIKPASYLPV